MQTKTITVDMEAYELLRAIKRDKESFSSAIKRRIKPPVKPDVLERLFLDNSLSEEAINSVEHHIKIRHLASKRKR